MFFAPPLVVPVAFCCARAAKAGPAPPAFFMPPVGAEHSDILCCHPRESGDPVQHRQEPQALAFLDIPAWIPACAGMTMVDMRQDISTQLSLPHVGREQGWGMCISPLLLTLGLPKVKAHALHSWSHRLPIRWVDVARTV